MFEACMNVARRWPGATAKPSAAWTGPNTIGNVLVYGPPRNTLGFNCVAHRRRKYGFPTCSAFYRLGIGINLK
jgi:hypothetical protein